MLNPVNQLASYFQKTWNRNRSRKRSTFRPAVESLEARELLAGDLLQLDELAGVLQSGNPSQIPVVESAAAQAAARSVPVLSSNPFATKKIYLDFDGQIVTGTKWNTNYNTGKAIHARAFSLDSDYRTFSAAEKSHMKAIWERVSEDFRPFNVDVTTVNPGSAAIKAGNRAIRVLITTDYDDSSMGGTGKVWYQNAGGVAYRGSWGWASDTPVWVFYNKLSSNDKSPAEAISHEVGHSLGLTHDGKDGTSIEYYKGHGSGIVGWAPIMGNSYGRELSQWSKGEYNGANNHQDDVAIIAGKLGFRKDDHGNGRSTARTRLVVSSSGNVYEIGIISQRSDVDYFKLIIGNGSRVKLDVRPFGYKNGGANLDVLAKLYDSSHRLIAQDNPADRLDASFDVKLNAGTYYLAVDGSHNGNDYSDYGSLGLYEITGRITGYALSTPVLTGPSFESIDTTPTLTWTGVTSGRRYELWVNDARGKRVLHNEHVSGTSFTASLQPGSYRAWVRAHNDTLKIASAWSPARKFTIKLRAPYVLSPTGIINDTTPTITWTRVAGADAYKWELYNAGGQRVDHNIVSSGTATNDTITSPLAGGRYRVRIKAANNEVESDWSPFRDFQITVTKPGTPLLYGPGGSTTDTTPTFRWSQAQHATWYYLYIRNNGTGHVFTKWIKAATSYTPGAAMSIGSYTFWVIGWGNDKFGDWSRPMQFKIESAKPGTPVLYGPSGSATDTTPTFRWSAAKHATWYYLYIRNNDTGHVRTKWIKGAISYTSSTMAKGSYTFWVIGWRNDKFGDWSKPMQFKIESAKPGTPVLYGPSGSTNDTTPTFRWSAAKHATWYYLYIRNNDTGHVRTKWIKGATSYTSSTMAKGSYTFWVIGWGNDKFGDWSRPMQFSIGTASKHAIGVWVANGYIFVGTQAQILARRCSSTPGWGLTGTVGEKIGGAKGLKLLSPRTYSNNKAPANWLWSQITETKRVALWVAPLLGKIGGTWYNITNAPGKPRN